MSAWRIDRGGTVTGVVRGLSAVDLDSGGASAIGVSDLDQDFGYAPPAHSTGEGLIGDTIFLDRNGDDIPDAGEGLEGVTVALYDSTGGDFWDNNRCFSDLCLLIYPLCGFFDQKRHGRFL